MNNNKIYIMAPSFHQAVVWAKRSGISRDQFCYIHTPAQLRGMERGTELNALAGWQLNKSYETVDEMVKLIAARDLRLQLVQL